MGSNINFLERAITTVKKVGRHTCWIPAFFCADSWNKAIDMDTASDYDKAYQQYYQACGHLLPRIPSRTPANPCV